jgi:hypothetical protein
MTIDILTCITVETIYNKQFQIEKKNAYMIQRMGRLQSGHPELNPYLVRCDTVVTRTMRFWKRRNFECVGQFVSANSDTNIE